MEEIELKAAACAMGKRGGAARAAVLSTEERAEIARKGGRKRAQTLSPEQRKEIARKAVQARWAKKTEDAPDDLSESGEPAKKEAAAVG
jgi:general stress protein YciG